MFDIAINAFIRKKIIITSNIKGDIDQVSNDSGVY